MKTALVTGASKGIGKATAIALLKAGWQVFGVSRSNPQIDQENFHWIEFDLMNFNQFAELVSQLPDQLDLLVNNAGIAYMVDFKNTSILDLNKQFDINVKSPMLLTQMVFSKLTPDSIVINIVSDAGLKAFPGFSVYGSSKAALAMFGQVLRLEAEFKVYNLFPGDTNTPLSHVLLGSTGQFDKLLQPEQIAETIIAIINNRPELQDIVITNNHLLQDTIGIKERNLQVLNVDEKLVLK